MTKPPKVQIGMNWEYDLLQRMDAQAKLERITRTELAHRAVRRELERTATASESLKLAA